MKNLFAFLNRFRTKRLTKEEIINETVAFYSADVTRRSSNGDKYGSNGCKYNHENGNHCAVGRLLLPKYQNQGVKLKGNTSTVGCFMDEHKLKTIDEALQKPYRGHKLDFWRSLQTLHDNGSNWQNDGLTEKGQVRVEDIKENYKSN